MNVDGEDRVLLVEVEGMIDRQPLKKNSKGLNPGEELRESFKALDYSETEIDGHKAYRLDVRDDRFPGSIHQYWRIVRFAYKYISGSITVSEGIPPGDGKSLDLTKAVAHKDWKLTGYMEKILRSVKFVRKVEE